MTTNAATRSARKTAPLQFSVHSDHTRDLSEGERYYRIELADGREALIAASRVTVEAGALIAYTEFETTVILAPGTWLSVYMCEALMAYDPWSILHLPEPTR